MIIFLHGQDTYRLGQKLKEIIEHYQKIHKSGLNLKHFDGAKLDFQDFQDDFRSVSMFGEKKLIILKNVTLNEDFKNKLLKDIKKFADSENIILFCEEKEIPADVFLNSLKKYGKWQEFQSLKGVKLRNWIKKELERYEARIDKGAIDKLMDFVGSNLWQMSNEIKKLVNYKAGQNIKIEDIELFVKPKIETDIFKTIDAISEKKKGQALGLLHQHLEKSDAPLYLLAMINFQLRNLLIVKSGARLNLSPYVVKKTVRQAGAFSFDELKKIYQKIFQADLNIKTGRIDPQIALDLLIVEI